LELEWEIILVDDRGANEDWSVVQRLAKKDPRIRGLRLSRNFGQQSAITAGFEFSSGDWIVVMDCDLQDRPEEITNLYRKALEGYKVVFGARKVKKYGLLKRCSSKCFYLVLSYLTNTKQSSEVNNFGIYHREVINAILEVKDYHRFFPTLIHWVGFEGTTVPVIHAERTEGKSNYTYRKLFSMALDVVISFSTKPMKIMVSIGALISMISFSVAFFYTIRALMGLTVVQGWATLMVSLWFLSGLIIFNLGICGLYIGQTFNQTKNRPIYIIEDTTFDKSL